MNAKDSVKTAVPGLEDGQIQPFAAGLQGQLIRPGDEEYDEARAVWNGMIDRYPAFVARCASPEDVIASVNFAQANDLLLSVRGGGHGPVSAWG
jgi:FAD/FMN-containing dehydrogenase